MIDILGDEAIYAQINDDLVNQVDNYQSIQIGGKKRFTVGAGKPPAGILRITSMLGPDGRGQVLAKLVDAKNSLEFAKSLIEQEED